MICVYIQYYMIFQNIKMYLNTNGFKKLLILFLEIIRVAKKNHDLFDLWKYDLN